MEVFTGTSGYSYPEWKGSFYPKKIKNAEFLQYYATQLRSVEINNTFYRMPRTSVIEGWTARVGGDFRFAVKATRRITHFKKLRDPDELLLYLLRGLSTFGGCLGPVLFQLPPTLKADVPLLSEFLARLPDTLDPAETSGDSSAVPLRAAFEFRHPSWFCDPVYDALCARGCALVGGDTDDDSTTPPLVRTGDYVYLRLRKTEYADGAVDRWAERLLGLGVREVYAYFKHEEIGPELAKELAVALASTGGSPAV